MVAGGLVSWLIATLDLDVSWLSDGRGDLVAALAGVAGVGVMVSGVIAFRAASTTVNPHDIESASAFVSTGPYRFTRNPMYLGMALLIAAFSLGLGSILGLIVGEVFFVAIMTRVQIRPEERMLASKLGVIYEQYCAKVRRWL